ncbi:unnamed protein product, partial [Rodentolepis nana]|uniref:Uncharacterized protein n=1 Tax=Rodentolepis nana TaxID=102285 RepID=A0A0R3TI21_RODNA
ENSRSQGATNLNNKRETVDSGTLRHSRLAKNQKQWTVALFDIANEKQWTVALSRSEENSRSQGATNLNNKGETVDSGTLRHSRLAKNRSRRLV